MSEVSFLDGPRLPPASGGAARHLIVLLHGYGADGNDLIDLARFWQPLFPETAFVSPHAPEPLPFEGFDGRQWFALNERTPTEYRIGAEAAQPILDRFLDRELDKLSLDGQSLSLVGFSQGAMMTLQCGLRRTTPPAALIAYSGLLPGVDRLKGINTNTPVLIVNGAEDDVVASYHGRAARDALATAGLQVDYHELEGLGHAIDDRGLSLGGGYLKNHHFG